MLGETHNLLPPDMLAEIRRYFAAENSALAKRYYLRFRATT
jgi:hypothetical protein